MVNDPGHKERYRQPIEQPFKPIEQAFKVHHFLKTFRRHAHRSQHGKFPPPQDDVCGNGIEHIGCRNQGNQCNEPKCKYIDNGYHSPVVVHAGSIVIKAFRWERFFSQQFPYGFEGFCVVSAFQLQPDIAVLAGRAAGKAPVFGIILQAGKNIVKKAVGIIQLGKVLAVKE